MFPNSPFRYVAVWIAAVVRKTPNSASFRRVDELCGRAGNCLHKRNDEKGRGTMSKKEGHVAYLVLLQHHEVEMSDSLLRILSHTLHESRVTDNIAHVLIDECIPIPSLRSRTIEKTHDITHFRRFSAALRPKPFFSVCTISTLAYCFR